MTNRRQSIYNALPWWGQNVAASLEGWRIRRDRYDKRFHQYLKEFLRTDWNDSAEEARLRHERLSQICEIASRSVPFYRDLFRSVGFDPQNFTLEEFTGKIPVISKDDVKRDPQRFLNLDIPPHETREKKTSGTTGSALHLSQHRDHVAAQWAVWWRHRTRFGLRLGDSYAQFGGRPVVPPNRFESPVWRRNLPMRQTYFSTFHITDETMPRVVDYLSSRCYDFITGHPSILQVLGSWMIRHNRRLTHPPRWMVGGSESLLSHQQATIERGFGRPITDQYGLAEGVANASQCEHFHYHIDEDFSHVELLPLGGSDLSLHRIVGTSFFNTAMPLLRYDTGDVATVSDRREGCPCGRVSRRLNSIDGRIESVIVTPDGRYIPRLDWVFKDTIRIREAQIHQRRMDDVVVRLVPLPGFGESDRAQLEAELRNALGPEVGLSLVEVDHIDRSPGGKLRMVISDYRPARTDARTR